MRFALRYPVLTALAAVLFLVGCPSSPPGSYILDVSGQLDGVGDGAGGDADVGADVVEPPEGLCLPCVPDGSCVGTCVAVDGVMLCLASCAAGGESCPDGLTCRDLPEGAFCAPPDGVCACSSKDAGTALPCASANDVGACVGEAVCEPSKGWICDAGLAEPESCDYLDNDCDGDVDEDFKVGEWYFGNEHCGDCGVACEVEHGDSFCSLSVTPPECFVSNCDPGFISTDGKTCEPAGGLACVPCETDDDCAGGICTTLEAAKYCFPLCPPECPDGYNCIVDVGHGDGVCEPVSGSCECTPETLGQIRGCQVLNEYGACMGQEICTEMGWGPCDAAVPLPEECNGIDENCNNLIDEGLPEDEPCVNTVPGIGTCVGVLICEGVAGWFCTAAEPMPEICDYVDNDCDGDVDDGFRDPVTGLYTGDQNCGFCENDCTVMVFPQAFGACLVDDVAGPACGMVCAPGWVDVDGDEENGCECPFISEEDPPDGVDQNCDGIDGEPENAIFVSVTGLDGNPGTPELPVRTVAKGLERAENAGKGHVYVTGGDFFGGAHLHEGVRVFCGFTLDFSVRDFEVNESILFPGIPGPGTPGTVTAVAVGLGAGVTSIEGCTIMGPVVTEPDASSYAVYARDVGPGLRIADNLILGGAGGDAESGDPGDHGSDGFLGIAGKWAYDVGFGSQCSAVNSQTGGPGGAKTCGGISVAGGVGGTAVCPDFDEWGAIDSCPVEEHQEPGLQEQGDSGLPTGGGGAGGVPGLDSIHTVMDNGMFCGWDMMNCSYCHVALGGSGGKNGKNGTPGANGAAGAGCSLQGGFVVGGLWTSSKSSGGGTGAYGAGGGGGGAAGGVEVYGCEETNQGSDVGGSGGGGGSGGCGATGGIGGGGGGGAFTIFLTWGQAYPGWPEIVGNALITGTGGGGGAGGAGGVGGTGGYGGDGGIDGSGDYSMWCVGEGGNGGHGGNGGAGGGGGGGCGGPEVGLFVYGPSAAGTAAQTAMQYNEVELGGSGGSGGSGGDSKGNDGAPGAAGLQALLHFLSN